MGIGLILGLAVRVTSQAVSRPIVAIADQTLHQATTVTAKETGHAASCLGESLGNHSDLGEFRTYRANPIGLYSLK